MARPTTTLDFGIEMDVTQFYPDIDRGGGGVGIGPGRGVSGVPGGVRVGNAAGTAGERDVSATTIALNVLVRWPVGVSGELPNGRWHPYLGIGGAAEIARAKQVLGGAKDADTSAAFQALAGLKVFLTKNIGLFTEYKFTHAGHTFTFPGGTPSRIPVAEDITLNVHHVVGGIAVHF